ncbi:MAG: hypothetical protein CM15mP56_1210 [Alphaproteobacteria bacterium]|nr:MAG: hypothetical protein CM15mP56_1210 [Alphaproteobacteria bacterium]
MAGSETLGQSVSSTFNNKNVGTGKTVTVNSITLSDGSNGGLASNYTISAGQTTTANITAKALTVSGITASNKTYDGNTNSTTDVTSAVYTGLVSGDNFVVAATGTFDNKNVGTGKTVSLSSSYSGSDVSNYSVTNQASTTANITAKTLTVSGITSSDKSYDGSTSATLVTSNILYTGLVNGDSFTGSYTGTFDNKNVGTGKTVTISSSYSGDDASNYSITNQSSTTAAIIKKALTASASASNKTYNGNTTASTTLSFSGLAGSETLGQSVSSTFNNKNVGTGKTVTVNSITLSDGSNGGLASNYTVSAGQTTTADITAKSLTVSGITASNKTYDANTNATVNIGSVSYSGLVSGDNFTVSVSGTFDNKNIGTGKTVTLSSSYSGSDVSNYSITNQASTTANVTAKALTVSGITASDKIYDGSTSATLGTSNVLYSGLINGDSFSGSYSGTFNNANVGAGKTVTISSSYSGDDVSNYSVTSQSSTTASIVKKSLTASATASNKTYNGNTTATTTLSFSGLVGSETLGQSVSSTFNNKNVGTGKTVTVNSITLSDGSNGGVASNYSISSGQTTTANITAKALTVSGITASNKTYDGNTVVTLDLTGTSYSGLVSGDDVSISASGSFDNKNVGTGKTVNISSSYSGSDVGNYSITDQATTTANITASVSGITVRGITASNKTYDGNNSATLDTSNVSYSGLVEGDDVTGSFSGTFSNANVGSNKTVNISSSYSGADVGNYTITDQSTTTGNIIAKALTATAAASNKTYNGNTTATVTLSFSGLIGSETLGQSVTAAFNNKNVGTGKTVNVSAITLSDGSNGGLASNYSISAGQTTTANITAKSLTVSGITASNKTYDGNTNATTDVTSASYSGLVSGDNFVVAATGTFNNKNVGTGKTVSLSSSYSGSDVSNYSVTDQSSTTANITAKALTVSGITASDKSYDGSTTATLGTSNILYTGLVSGDSFSGSYTGTFDNKNVGTGKTVTISSSYSGDDVSNYSVTDQSSTTATIIKKALTASASASNKTYNGNATATTSLTFSGLVGSETLGQSVTSAFNNKNVGTGKTVTISAITLSDGSNGGLASNYTISAGQTTTANITAKALTVSGITASNKTYDANTNATMVVTSASYSGLLSGDNVVVSATGTFDNKNIGTGKTVTISSSYSGSDVSNYSITNQSSTTANVTARSLTVSGITASDKSYDGSATATLGTSNILYTGLVNGDSFSGSYTGTFNNANVASGKTVTISSSYSGDDVSNYSVTDQSSTTASIVKKSLTATTSASNKTYNGDATATTTLSFSGLVGSETLGQSVSSTFNNKNVGTGKTVTVNSITLSDGSNGGLASNYTISAGQTTTANITGKSLTVSGITAPNKTYDGNTNAPLDISNISYSGLVSGDDIGGSFSGAFDNKNIGTSKTVSISASYSGVDSGNYTVTDQSSTTANITARTLTVSGLTASNKTYDATTSATLDTSNISYAGLVSGDSFSGSYTGTFNNANVGTSKLVTISSSYSGDDINNYSITDQSSTGADITKASPTISGLSAQSKYSDESYTLAGTPSISGLSIAYSSSNTSIASVGSSTGAVSILSTGTSTITASIAATSNYNAASATYILTVSTRPTSNGSPSQVATYTAIRSMNENVSNSSGNISIRGSNGNLNNTSISGGSISAGKNSVISSQAKVIVLRPNLVPATEGIYEFSNNEDEDRLKPPEKNNESFQKLGEIIGVVDYLVQIESENKTYNYNLEVRDGGILIKPKNLDSFSFAEFNKSVVIDKAMGAVQENFGIPTFQIKTIVIDLLSNIASN